MFNMHQIAGGDLSPMGFSVYVTDETKEYAPGQQIEFAGTVSNIGQHYQNRSHIFICPVHGLYVFTVSLTSVNDGVPYSAVIIHEGAMLTSVVTHDGNNDQGQALAVTSCYAGRGEPCSHLRVVTITAALCVYSGPLICGVPSHSVII